MSLKAPTTFPDRPKSDPAGPEEKLALIERIAASEHFRRSVRLRDFLLYVGQQSLKENAAELNEQDIGAHVFGRDAGYDRSQDNIVRVNASELRKRIEHYFATDGAKEPLVLEIPRGGYRPIFHLREHHVLQEDLKHSNTLIAPLRPELLPAAPAPIAAKHLRVSQFLWPAACLVLLGLCIAFYLQMRSLQASLNPLAGKPAVSAFWNGFVANRQQADIVLPDDSMSLVEDITHQPVSLDDYINRSFVDHIENSSLSADRKADAREVMRHNLITFGGMRAEGEVTSTLMRTNIVTKTWLSHYYSPDLIKTDNVVLIGGEKANPWVHLFDDRLNFITSYLYDSEHSHAVILNQKPQAGEQAQYFPDSHGYSVLAYMPNLGHTSNVIILAGTDSDSTGAAAEFLLSEDRMEGFEKMLHVTKLPYFEVLLRTSGVNGASLNAEIVAYRIH